MDDRGEKIVNLAREILRADSATETTKPVLSLKLLCLTTLLAAFGGGGVTEMIEHARRPITRVERMELDALVFYIAKINDTQEETLRAELRSKLGIDNFAALNEHEFQIVRRFLQDQYR